MRTRLVSFGSVGGDASGTTRNISAIVTFPGNGIRGAFKFEGGGTTSFKVTDTAGNVYRSGVGYPGLDANGLRINPNGDLGVGIFWCDNAKAHPANVITVTLASARSFFRCFAFSEDGSALHHSLTDLRIQEATTGTTSTPVTLPRGGTLMAILGEYASTTWACPGDPSVIVQSSGSTGFAYRHGLGSGSHNGTFSGAGIEAETQIIATFAPRRIWDSATGAPAPSGEMTGTAAIGFGAGTSTLQGAGALTGSAAVLFGAGSSAIRADGALAGSTPIVITPAATLTGAGALSGAADVTITPAGAIAGAGALAGASALVFTPAASLAGAGALSGAAALTFVGTLTPSGDLAGAAAMVFTPAAALTGAGALAGASAMVFGGTLFPSGALAGAAAILITPTGSLAGTGDVSGTSALVLVGQGAAEGTGALAGASGLVFGGSAQAAEGALQGTAALAFVLLGVTSGGTLVYVPAPLMPRIFEMISGDATCLALLGNPVRVYRHGRAPQDKPRAAYLTWFVVVGDPANNLSELPDIDRIAIQIDCWDVSDQRVEDLARAVRNALEPYGHMTGIDIDERETATKFYRVALQFDIWHHRFEVAQ